jgi:hypothetical protein
MIIVSGLVFSRAWKHVHYVYAGVVQGALAGGLAMS